MMDYSFLFSDDVQVMEYSAIRRMAKLAMQPGIISFSGGFPSAETFPVTEIRDVTASILETEGKAALQYGMTLGHSGLHEVVLECVQARGIPDAALNQIAITSGSQQALDLLGRLFINPGDCVFFELPSYVGAIAAFRNLRAKLVGVRQQLDGIDLADLARQVDQERRQNGRPKILYLVPNFQNPSGVTLSQEKRRQLMELCNRENLVVIEDDPYGEIYFDSTVVSRLKPLRSMDPEGRVIYLSTFSKILCPGLRTGWVLASPLVIEKLDLAKQAADLCGSMLDQRIVAECWKRGIIQNRLPEIRSFYRKRCNVMLGALREFMPAGISWTEPLGGLFIWMTLSERLNSELLLNASLEQAGVSFVIGPPFFVNREGSNTLRLAFSKESEDNIALGIEKLAQVIRHHLS
ncbi:MAG: PLP-dependent aminotransferase family protein [Acidobacteriota bacterium]